MSYNPGDIVLCHSSGIIGKAIRSGERLHGDRNDAQWNHAALIKESNGKGDYYVIQAEAKGVTDCHLLSEIAPGGRFQVVALPEDVLAEDVLHFAKSQVGAKYGFLTIASIVMDLLLPDSICFRKAKTWICSGLVSASLMFGGWDPSTLLARSDIYTTTPAELAESLGA